MAQQNGRWIAGVMFVIGLVVMAPLVFVVVGLADLMPRSLVEKIGFIVINSSYVLGPGLVVLAAWTWRRGRLRRRDAILAALLVAAGLLQLGYYWWSFVAQGFVSWWRELPFLPLLLAPFGSRFV